MQIFSKIIRKLFATGIAIFTAASMTFAASAAQAPTELGIGLILSSTSLQQIPVIGEAATLVLGNITAFVSPALLVVATKSLIASAKD